jgi:predicted HicB family RNase H-like nuclease
MLKYKGYLGKIEYDDEAEIFFGVVIGIRDVITFEATDAKTLKQAFIDSVEDYLEFCASEGKEPERAYSGKIHLRIDDGLHRQIAYKAEALNISINHYIEQTLRDHL